MVSSPSDPFGRYYAEILRGEGLNEFSVENGPVTAGMLSGKQVVILGAGSVTDAEVAALTTWVQGGGNLIAMRPDKKLAGLLGLSDAGGTLANGYMKVDQGSASGAGIDDQTLQFHGTADRYGLNGASEIATLFSDAVTQTSNPAVTLRDVGSGGGQAAAFTYDLARSVVYTRQGNPAWAGQKRDSSASWIRATDLFYGAKAGDVQPDWVDPARFDVPQADEQQRLLANLITEMNLDKAPLPRLWYLPRGEKAAVVLTPDDHATGGVIPYLNRLKATDPPGCSVADWECPRASAYLYPDTPLTDAQAKAFENDGFEIGLHLTTGCQDYTPASLENNFNSQLGPVRVVMAERQAARVEPHPLHPLERLGLAGEGRAQPRHPLRHELLLHGPELLAAQAGPDDRLGIPAALRGLRRHDDRHLSGDDAGVGRGQRGPADDDADPHAARQRARIEGLLGRLHGHPARRLRRSPATERPRLGSSEPRRAGGLLGTDAGLARRPQRLVLRQHQLQRRAPELLAQHEREGARPAGDAAGPLRDRPAVQAHARRPAGLVESPHGQGRRLRRLRRQGRELRGHLRQRHDRSRISGVTATADAEGHATVKWTTDEPSTSVVEYGRTTALGSEKADSAQVTDHSVELGGLQPNTTYNFRVRSADSAGNTASSPAGAPATFSTPPGALVDSRTAEFAAGSQSATLAGDSLDALDGEVQLQPTVAENFDGTSLSAPWTMRAFDAGGSVVLGGGVLLADDAVAHTTGFYDPPRVIEFSAAFRPVNDQAVGFGTDLTQAPFAAFSTGVDGDPFQLYASSVAGGGLPETDTPLPGVTLGVAHRFRIEWTPTRVDFFVDGVSVATHNHSETIDGPLRPAISDFGLFGASTKVHWLRMGGYGTTGMFTSRVLDSGPGARTWTTLTAASTLPTGTGITFETRSGGTATPGTTWSGWQAVGSGGAIASPAARFIQYRARLTSSSGRVTPTLQRVQIGYGAGTDRPPVGGTVSIAAGRAEDQPGRDRHAQRVQRPRRRSADLPLPLVPQRPGDRGRDLQLAQPRARPATVTAATPCAPRCTPPTAAVPRAIRLPRP